MYRLFVAVDFPDDAMAQVLDTCYGVREARWTPREQIHLTLRFIGEVGNSVFDAICSALCGVEVPPFPISLKGAGYFPPRGTPRVLWLGVDRSDELLSLHTQIETAMNDAGIARDGRKFRPHITVARLRPAASPESIIPFLSRNSLFKTDPFKVNRFHLFSSTLRKEGALHTVEETYPLR